MSSALAQSVMPIVNWSLIAPEVIICAAAVVVMLVDAFVRPTQRWITGSISLVGIVAAVIGTVWHRSTGTAAPHAYNGRCVRQQRRHGFSLVYLRVPPRALLA